MITKEIENKSGVWDILKNEFISIIISYRKNDINTTNIEYFQRICGIMVSLEEELIDKELAFDAFKYELELIIKEAQSIKGNYYRLNFFKNIHNIITSVEHTINLDGNKNNKHGNDE